MFDEQKVLDYLKKVKKSSFTKMAINLHIRKKENKEFSKFLNKLIDEKKIFTGFKRDYFVPKNTSIVTGTIRLNPKGFGFVDFEDKSSVFIAAHNVNGAMDNDEVELKSFDDPNREGEKQGFVTKVIKRSREQFVGRIVKFGKHLGIKPKDPRIRGIFRFKNLNNVEVDNEVLVKITEYGKPSYIEVLKVLGKKDDVSIDIYTSIVDSGVPYEFNVETLDEARTMPEFVDEKDYVGRIDLRNEMIVTIDGDDTKDFDDAVEVQKLENGNYKLSVHIADVTHYVKEGDALDNEAKNRGTSVYLADRVIPMLPVELSNGICSLNPNVDRLTITCEAEISPSGETISQKIFPSVIKSKYRLTYNEVNKYYRNDFTWNDKKLEGMLDVALELSKIIRKFKEKEGYIDFEISESKLIIDDETGKTTNIVPRARLESEMMIEDFMVRANETVAKYVSDNKLAFIYRVHDKPDLDRVTSLQNIVKTLKIDVKIPTYPIPSEFAKSINQIKETRFDDFMKMMMLRTMSKAEYSPNNIGHFGLASKYYTHFTSPIRRYPDLMVHRMLREYFFEGHKNKTKHFEEILPSIAANSSDTEVRAVELERKVADMKKAEFYEQFIGQKFEGTIISMMKFGFFVEFPNKVDGLVHISTLTDGNYDLSKAGYSMTNGNTTYTIGDKVTTVVVGIEKDEGKIDLVLEKNFKEWKERESKLMKNH